MDRLVLFFLEEEQTKQGWFTGTLLNLHLMIALSRVSWLSIDIFFVA